MVQDPLEDAQGPHVKWHCLCVSPTSAVSHSQVAYTPLHSNGLTVVLGTGKFMFCFSELILFLELVLEHILLFGGFFFSPLNIFGLQLVGPTGVEPTDTES